TPLRWLAGERSAASETVVQISRVVAETDAHVVKIVEGCIGTTGDRLKNGVPAEVPGVIAVPIRAEISEMFSGSEVLIGDVGRESAEIRAAHESHVVELETRAKLLVGERSVEASGFCKRQLADMAGEIRSRRIVMEILRVGALI